jgi:hypothetical protein
MREEFKKSLAAFIKSAFVLDFDSYSAESRFLVPKFNRKKGICDKLLGINRF